MDKTILHIEDNFENRLLVRRLLVADGYQVMEAENALEALRILNNGTPPQLILLDINMPDIDGYALTARIKSVQSLKTIPIVAITANVMRGDREKVFQAGCNGYIEKPIDIDRFSSQIASYFQNPDLINDK